MLALEKEIFNLKDDNVESSVQTIISLFDGENPSLFCNLICRNAFSFYYSHGNVDLVLNMLCKIGKYFIDKNVDIINVFIDILMNSYSKDGSYYVLMIMLEKNLISFDVIEKIQSLYFVHIQKDKYNIDSVPYRDPFISEKNVNLFYEQIKKNYQKISKNDWELHKQLIKEGVNPNEIAKIIRKDEVEKLQEITSQTKFDFDQTIEPSLYERCSFINQEYVSLIDYAAFFGSIKCFKYLLMNSAKVNNTGKYAVAGGNLEIIHLCEQNHSTFEYAYEAAIEFHRNDIFKYLYENKIEKINNLEELGQKCLKFNNYEFLPFLLKEGMEIKKFLFDAIDNKNIYFIHFLISQEGIDNNTQIQIGNIALIYATSRGYLEIVKFLLEQNRFDVNTRDYTDQTALILAVQYQKTEIAKLLLKQKDIDVNAHDRYGYTALIWAAMGKSTEMVKLLLEKEGIDLNAKNYYGNTALMFASSKGETEIVKLLQEASNKNI